MADLGGAFRPSDVKEDLRTPGIFMTAQIIKSDLVTTKNGNGQMLKFLWQVLDGPDAGASAWQQITYRNMNKTAEDIGQRELKKICDATGLGVIQNTEELHMRPCRVKFKTREDSFGTRSEIAAYERIGNGPTSQRIPESAMQQPAAPAAVQSQPNGSPPQSRPWR